ncbi:MAG: competence/damage-inducible protein A [Verrucomicrobia bacterium]|nr:competence/damage-inducible protein A [Verrucomicrobiota bacterium]
MNQAELISIGNELLSGQTLNTHAKDLGTALAAIGLQLVRDTTIPDDIPTIGSAVGEALGRTRLVFASGGLGPTVDDITRDALATMLGQEIVLDGATVATIAKRYAARGRAMTPAAERQALVLENATVLPNSVGAAPGQRIELAGEKTLFVLPGPPGEFNAILNEEIIPWLRERFPDARPKLLRIVRTAGIGESDIATLLESAGFQPARVALGFYPGKGRVQIRISADPGHEREVDTAEQTLRGLLADFLDPSS